jgi:hypothetical protein
MTHDNPADRFAYGIQESTAAITDLIKQRNQMVDQHDFVAMADSTVYQHELLQRAQQWQKYSQELLVYMRTHAVNMNSFLPTESHVAKAAVPAQSHPVMDKIQQLVNTNVRNEPTLGLDEDWEFTAPIRFQHLGAEYQVSNYRALYSKMLELCAMQFPRTFVSKCSTVAGGRTRKFMSDNPADFLVAIAVAGVYFEGNLSANKIRSNIIILLTQFEVDPSEFVVWIRRR